MLTISEITPLSVCQVLVAIVIGMIIMLKKLAKLVAGPRLSRPKYIETFINLSFIVLTVCHAARYNGIVSEYQENENNLPDAPAAVSQRVRVRLVGGVAVEGEPIEWNGRMHSRAAVARAIGMSHSGVVKIFNGTRQPGMKAVLKLAQYFQVSVEVLLTQILPRIEVKRY